MHSHGQPPQPLAWRTDVADMGLPAVQFALRWLILAGLALLVGAGSVEVSQAKSNGAQDGGLSAAAAPRESWEGVSRRLATSLVDPDARALEEPLFLPRATVRRFGAADAQSASALREQFDGWQVLGVEAFEYPAARVVADACAMLRIVQSQDPSIPDSLVRALTPPAAELPAAEQTAGRWVTSALAPARGDKVALLLLWNPGETNLPMFERLVFVLIKAGRLPDGRYRVQTVSYGTAQQAVLEGF